MLEMLKIQNVQGHVKHIDNMRLVTSKGFFCCFHLDKQISHYYVRLSRLGIDDNWRVSAYSLNFSQNRLHLDNLPTQLPSCSGAYGEVQPQDGRQGQLRSDN